MFYSCLLGRGSPASTAGCTPSRPWLLTAADCRCDVQLRPHQSASTHLLNSCWMWNSPHLAHPVIHKMVLCDEWTYKTVTVTECKMFIYFNNNFKSLKRLQQKGLHYTFMNPSYMKGLSLHVNKQLQLQQRMAAVKHMSTAVVQSSYWQNNSSRVQHCLLYQL